MNDNPQYVYIMYPVPMDQLKNLPVFKEPSPKPQVPVFNEEEFMPLWYGTARFPEDDV